MPVNNDAYNYSNYMNKINNSATKTKEENEVVKETDLPESNVVAKQEPETYKPDMEKIQQMKDDLKGNMAAFKQMVYSQIKNQGNGASDALKQILEQFSDMSQEEAAAAISDNGDWGIDATANRILDFAIAISGGDPSKIDTLRNAVEQGYKAASKAFGDNLPDICQKTLEKVMSGFDEWEKTGSAANIGSNAQSNAASQALS